MKPSINSLNINLVRKEIIKIIEEKPEYFAERLGRIYKEGLPKDIKALLLERGDCDQSPLSHVIISQPQLLKVLIKTLHTLGIEGETLQSTLLAQRDQYGEAPLLRMMWYEADVLERYLSIIFQAMDQEGEIEAFKAMLLARYKIDLNLDHPIHCSLFDDEKQEGYFPIFKIMRAAGIKDEDIKALLVDRKHDSYLSPLGQALSSPNRLPVFIQMMRELGMSNNAITTVLSQQECSAGNSPFYYLLEGEAPRQDLFAIFNIMHDAGLDEAFKILLLKKNKITNTSCLHSYIQSETPPEALSSALEAMRKVGVTDEYIKDLLLGRNGNANLLLEGVLLDMDKPKVFSTLLNEMRIAEIEDEEIKSLLLQTNNSGNLLLVKALEHNKSESFSSILTTMHEVGIKGNDFIDALLAKTDGGISSFTSVVNSQNEEFLKILFDTISVEKFKINVPMAASFVEIINLLPEQKKIELLTILIRKTDKGNREEFFGRYADLPGLPGFTFPEEETEDLLKLDFLNEEKMLGIMAQFMEVNAPDFSARSSVMVERLNVLYGDIAQAVIAEAKVIQDDHVLAKEGIKKYLFLKFGNDMDSLNSAYKASKEPTRFEKFLGAKFNGKFIKGIIAELNEKNILEVLPPKTLLCCPITKRSGFNQTALSEINFNPAQQSRLTNPANAEKYFDANELPAKEIAEFEERKWLSMQSSSEMKECFADIGMPQFPSRIIRVVNSSKLSPLPKQAHNTIILARN